MIKVRTRKISNSTININDDHKISGIVIDKDDTPIPYAIVKIYAIYDMRFITYVVANESGEFYIDNVKIEDIIAIVTKQNNPIEITTTDVFSSQLK